ncbi:MAG: T9SS type A sorting domain-containing protein [Flavobacteriales bacterium]|nr:T9SS type A sorting domain-containing protein [Flavobacteriales bacterium]
MFRSNRLAHQPLVITAMLYACTSSAQFTVEHRFVFPATNSALTIADTDGDGDGDILRSISGSLHIMVQDAPGVFNVVGPLAPDGGARHFRMADLDGDLVDDIVFAGPSMNQIRWMRGLGGGAYDQSLAIVNTTFAAIDAQPWDVDGDGDLDLVHANAQGAIRWSLNDGNAVFTTTTLIQASSGSVNNANLVVLFDAADLDGDGDLDLATAYPNPRWFSNDGSGQFSLNTLNPVGTELTIADINADGIPDIAALQNVGAGFELRCMFGLGNGQFQPPATAISSVLTNAYVLFEADLNGDGVDDLGFQDHAGIADPHSIVGLLNNGSGTLLFSWTGLLSDDFKYMACGDLDGDGVMDFAAPCNDRLRAVQSSGPDLLLSSIARPQWVQPIQLTSTQRAVCLTEPGTGSPLAEGPDPLRIVIHDNVNGLMSCSPQQSRESPSGIRSHHAADLDSDGDEDLVVLVNDAVTYSSRRVAIYTNNNGVLDSTAAIGTISGPGGVSDPWLPIVRDMDADGDVDILWSNQLSLNNGNGTFAPTVTLGLTAWGANFGTGVCDVDGDGDPDHIWKYIFSGLPIMWNENLGGGLPGPDQTLANSPFSLIPSSQAELSMPQVQGADLTNDGWEDLVLFSGDSIAFLVNAGGTFPSAVERSCGAVAYTIGDINSDGLPEVIAMRSTGEVITWLNQGGGQFSVEVQLASAAVSSGGSHLALADVDTDGDMDILTCSTSGYAAWLENDGNVPTAAPSTAPLEDALRVVPNPLREESSIMLPAGLPLATAIDLYDAQGRWVRSLRPNGTTILPLRRDGLAAGIYVLRAAGLATRVVIE